MHSSSTYDTREIIINEDYKIKIYENNKFGVAGEIWNSAFLLSSLMISKKCKKLMENKTILEIGSGTGICGLFASLASAKKVYLTDREDNLEILYKNYEINKKLISANNCEISIKAVDWNYPPSFKNIEDKIDLIIASDIIYHGLNYNKIIDLMKFFSQNKNINLNSNRKLDLKDTKNISNTEILLAFTNRLGSSLEFFDILDLEKEAWEIRNLNIQSLELGEEIIEKVKYSQMFSLKYLNK